MKKTFDAEGANYITVEVSDNKGASSAKHNVVQMTVDVKKKPHQFTSDIKVVGSDEYDKYVKSQLDEIGKTPDAFSISRMTALGYVTHFIDELDEGPEGNCREPKAGCDQFPKYMIPATNLIHIARHNEQGQNQTFLKNMEEWNNRYSNDSPGLFAEHDAIRLQVSWEKARYNLTDEQERNSFLSKMKYYTNDSKYFEEELIKN